MIVGIDPGTTSAVAVLSLDHELLGTKSAKNFSKDQIISYIIDHGKPLIVAADVAHAPSLIEDVAANMGADTFTPADDLPAQDKEDATRQFDIQSRDTHTMDAAAAAEYAYREHEDKIADVRQRAETAGLGYEQSLDVVELVVNGSLSTQQAIREVEKRNQSQSSQSQSETQSSSQQPNQEHRTRNWEQIAGKRQERIDRLTDKVKHLQDYVNTLEDRLDDQEQESASGVDDEALKRRNREINELRQTLSEKTTRIEQLEAEQDTLRTALHNIINEDWVYVPETRKLENAPAAIVYCDDYRGGPVSSTLDTVITTTDAVATRRDAYDALAQQGVNVVPLSQLEHVALEQGYVVSPDDLKTVEAADDAGSERFLEWLETYRKRQTT